MKTVSWWSGTESIPSQRKRGGVENPEGVGVRGLPPCGRHGREFQPFSERRVSLSGRRPGDRPGRSRRPLSSSGQGERKNRRCGTKPGPWGSSALSSSPGFKRISIAITPLWMCRCLRRFSEGLSITLLESMQSGIPVVATRVGGNPEVVVEGETGYLVSPGDVPAIAAQTVKLLQDRGLRKRMGEEGRRHVMRHFLLRDVASRYLEIYEGLLSRI